MENAQFAAFISYISDNPGITAVHETVCAAWKGEKRPFSMPIGKAYLYSRYFVFLTTQKGEQGTFKQAFSTFWEEFEPYLKAHRWAHNPAGLIPDILRAFGMKRTDEEEAFVNAALASSNSWAIPTEQIQSVEKKRDWNGCQIAVRTTTGKFTICQNYLAEVPDPVRYVVGALRGQGKPLKKISFKNVPQFYWSFASGKWNEKLADSLLSMSKTGAQ